MSLHGIGIAGLRGYSSNQMQKLYFAKPLTLIYGKNGSGKTTIIEGLKFITTGSYPPHCGHGKSFIMDSKLAGCSQVQANVILKFSTATGRQVRANRKLLVKVTDKATKVQSKQQTLETKDQKTGEIRSINHQCCEIEKQMPELLGTSKAILQKIAFCHQQQTQWPFSDNTILKNIFDELFETKKFTKIMQAMWQKHKEHAKELKQSKIKLSYQKSQYQDDINRKQQCLNELQKLAKLSIEMRKQKSQLQKIKRKQNMYEKEIEKRNIFMQQKGSLNNQININHQHLKMIEQKLIKLLQKNNEKLQEIKLDDCKDNLTQQQKNLNQLKQQKIHLQNKFEQMRFNQYNNRKNTEIYIQIKRIKQIIPRLKYISYNEKETFLKELRKQCQFRQNNQNQLIILKEKYDQQKIPELLNENLTVNDFQICKKKLEQQEYKLRNLEIQIIKIYNLLYKKIDNIIYENFDDDFEKKFNNFHAVMKCKREQLKKYCEMPKKESIDQKVSWMTYVGITLQDKFMHFCKEKSKCFICSKKLNDEDLNYIQLKINKNKEKTVLQIEKQKANSDQNDDVNTELMIKQLKHYIRVNTSLQKQFNEKYQRYIKWKQDKKQLQINRILNDTIQSLGIEIKKIKIISITTNIQQFQTISINYYNLKQQVMKKYCEIKQYKQKKQRNKIIFQQQQRIQEIKIDLLHKIKQIQLIVQQYPLIYNIYKKLNSLIQNNSKNKNKNKYSDINQSKSSINSIDQIQERIKNLKIIIQQQQQENYKNKLLIQYKHFHLEKEEIFDKCFKIEQNIQEIDRNLNQNSIQMNKQNELRIQFEKKKRQIQIRVKILEQDIARPISPSYFNQKCKVKALEQSIHDISKICESMDDAVSKYHHEKMQEVNQIMKQVWSQIYHEDDISYIEISSVPFQQGVKRRRNNYNYNIMMKKKTKLKRQQSIEMKGRSSMGQKVLASIVVRLALAEVFSTHSRILALDEPTTNLDKAHIHNLAEQLVKLIEVSGDKNLQLIIISHDLQFIQMLQEHATHYYEISRNQENFSIISKKQIKQIFIKY